VLPYTKCPLPWLSTILNFACSSPEDSHKPESILDGDNPLSHRKPFLSLSSQSPPNTGPLIPSPIFVPYPGLYPPQLVLFGFSRPFKHRLSPRSRIRLVNPLVVLGGIDNGPFGEQSGNFDLDERPKTIATPMTARISSRTPFAPSTPL